MLHIEFCALDDTYVLVVRTRVNHLGAFLLEKVFQVRCHSEIDRLLLQASNANRAFLSATVAGINADEFATQCLIW